MYPIKDKLLSQLTYQDLVERYIDLLEELRELPMLIRTQHSVEPLSAEGEEKRQELKTFGDAIESWLNTAPSEPF